MTWPTEQAREAVRDELAHTTIGTGYYSVTVGIDEAVEMAGAVLAALAPHVEAMLDRARAEALEQYANDLAANESARHWVGHEMFAADVRDYADSFRADRIGGVS